jgi:hypothetical protein
MDSAGSLPDSQGKIPWGDVLCAEVEGNQSTEGIS